MLRKRHLEAAPEPAPTPRHASALVRRFPARGVRQAGLPDHPGGNLARAWASYGRPAAPGAVGSIAVMRSHVGIVTDRCEDGRVQVLSGNHNRTTGYGRYPAGRIVAWRAAE